jgi:DNA-binding NarL/FixJ family response regulator
MQPITILIADDDAMIRQCLRRAVECDPRLQICWEADNGLQALVMTKQHHPDLVLMDAQMPRMDGIEATRCLRKCDKQTRILVMSVYDQMRAPALAAGADGFVTKDCGCEAIRKAIRQLVGPRETETARG